MTARLPLLLAASALGAAPAAPAAGARSDRDIEINGPLLNGTDLGRPRTLSVVLLREGVELADGKVRKDLSAEGGALRLPGQAQGGAVLLGAKLQGVASDRAPVRIRIDGIGAAADPRPETPQNENEDLALYLISYQDGAWEGAGAARRFVPRGDFRPACPGGERAVALGGRWDYHLGKAGDSGRLSADPREVTFACQGGAIAKCVERMGYKPWRREKGQALSALHEACVRAIRADYCGDGASLTKPGQEVNIFDALGVQTDTAPWVPEAAWTARGASCVSSTRLLDHPREAGVTVRAAIGRGCAARWSGTPCATTAGRGGAVLWTEHPPR